MSEHRSLVPPTGEILAELAMLDRRRAEARKLLKMAQERDAHARALPALTSGGTGYPGEQPPLEFTSGGGSGLAGIIRKDRPAKDAEVKA